MGSSEGPHPYERASRPKHFSSRRLTGPADTNRVDLFQRVPSELRKYREFVYNIEKKHGSMQKFIMQKRLRWTCTVPSGPAFTNPGTTLLPYPRSRVADTMNHDR